MSRCICKACGQAEPKPAYRFERREQMIFMHAPSLVGEISRDIPHGLSVETARRLYLELRTALLAMEPR